jgi:hypothetical protein
MTTQSKERGRTGWQAGEQARLWWNGFPQVPKYMTNWLVTIVSGPRGGGPRSLPTYRVLTHDGETRTVRCDQLIEANQ